jgi:hypothetical protein
LRLNVDLARFLKTGAVAESSSAIFEWRGNGLFMTIGTYFGSQVKVDLC